MEKLKGKNSKGKKKNSVDRFRDNKLEKNIKKSQSSKRIRGFSEKIVGGGNKNPTGILKNTCSLFKGRERMRFENDNNSRKSAQKRVSFNRNTEIYRFKNPEYNYTHEVGVDNGFNPGYFTPVRINLKKTSIARFSINA